jgi:diguanylate cyclase (GGDEF)-like protein
MFDLPDLSTLRLCSLLASTAFALVFAAAGWRQRMPYMWWWAAATGSYSAVLLGYEAAGEPLSPWVAGPLNGLLALSIAFILAGIRAFDGQVPLKRWMLGVVAGVAIVPAIAMGLPGAAGAMTARILLSLGLGFASFLFCWPLLVSRADDGTRMMRRFAGVALLVYVPCYVAAAIGEFLSARAVHYIALVPMLADQMLMGIANLSLLSIPGLRSQQQLRQMALRDPLTGVGNRAALAAGAAGLLVPGRVALLIDVDRFKAINDRHGHAVGDRVLVAIATALQRSVGGDFVARLGGDEFLVITRADDPAQAAERLRRCASRGEAGLPAWTLSIGAAPIEPGDRSIDDVIQRADLLMYRAKGRGRTAAAA